MNGPARAVPGLLYRYSDRTTQAIDATASLVDDLAAAIARYRQTALDFGGSIDDVTAPDGRDLATLLRAALPEIRATDRRVRAVARAFEHACPTTTTPTTATPATATDAQIGAYLAASGQPTT